MSKRILIVEDEILVALDLEDALTRFGYDVVGIAADRREALRLADRADLALVDVNLRDGATGLDIGMTLTTEFDVRVIFLTANPSSVGNSVSGVVGCLGKPCETETIRAAIEVAAGLRPPTEAPQELRLF